MFKIIYNWSYSSITMSYLLAIVLLEQVTTTLEGRCQLNCEWRVVNMTNNIMVLCAVRPANQFHPPPVSVEDGPKASLPPSVSDFPIFDKTLSTNVSVPLGSSATLHCSVRNAKDLRVGSHQIYKYMYSWKQAEY